MTRDSSIVWPRDYGEQEPALYYHGDNKGPIPDAVILTIGRDFVEVPVDREAYLERCRQPVAA
jgi:hypothetical protein